jgi:hypothetical protein
MTVIHDISRETAPEQKPPRHWRKLAIVAAVALAAGGLTVGLTLGLSSSTQQPSGPGISSTTAGTDNSSIYERDVWQQKAQYSNFALGLGSTTAGTDNSSIYERDVWQQKAQYSNFALGLGSTTAGTDNSSIYERDVWQQKAQYSNFAP